MNPKVTVLMTVYNRETVSKTIDSILQQTFKDFEFLIIDNASTDNTQKIINSYTDKRIRLYINDNNYGQTYSLNRGLTLAQGEYIARIDADDIALPDRLMKQVQFLDENQDYGLCGSWVRYISETDELTITMKMPDSNELLRSMQLFACGMYHPTAMYRRNIIVDNNICYDPEIVISEDYEIWRKILLFSKGINLPEILVYYRKGDNDSVRHEALMFREALQVRENIYNYEFNNLPYLNRKLQKVIELEKKEKKNIFELFYIMDILIKSSKKKYNIKVLNNKILRFHFMMHLYTVGLHFNNALWAKILNKFYVFCKSIKYKTARG